MKAFENCIFSAKKNWFSELIKYLTRCLWGQIFLCIISHTAAAQDIVLKNPSFEGKVGQGVIPPPWYTISGSLDTHPGGCCDINKPASHGDTYLGAVVSNSWAETFSQKISGFLKAGSTYTVSFDLSFPEYYYKEKLCYASFAIYGRTSETGAIYVLWKSGLFNHTEWRRYTAKFTPPEDCTFISFAPYYEASCPQKYAGGVLIDNFSPTIREVPQLEIITQDACRGTNTGSAKINVKGGIPPYRYAWSPEDNNSDEAKNLYSGVYEITVTGANGAAVKKQITIGESDIRAVASLIPPSCYGFNDAGISVKAEGGNPPYKYDLNDGNIIQEQPSFNQLSAGIYRVRVLDTKGCEVVLNNLLLKEPSPLAITSIHVTPVSCSEKKDGKILLDLRGGTAPYSFSMNFHYWQRDSFWNQLEAGKYFFQVKDNNNCQVVGEAEVVKNWRDCTVFIPTAFSPNGDGLNDIFRARVNDQVFGYHLTIYNRWGQLVFQTNDPAGGWDGGQQTTGNYLWVLTYTDSKKQFRKQQGNFLLIK